MNPIKIPELSLIALVGVSCSGKSSFAKKHFKSTEVISSDVCRCLVSDDENDQGVSKEAFEVLHYIAEKRLGAGKLTVIDATNVGPDARKQVIDQARKHHCIPVAIVLNLPEKLCQERNQRRSDRNIGPHVIRQQGQMLRSSIRRLKSEGFTHVYVLNSQEDIDQVVIERQRMWTDLKHEKGPFDIIGDIHGCYDELCALLNKLGYQISTADDSGIYDVKPPPGRKVIFLGDFVDRGPKTPEVMQLVMDMVDAGIAICVPGNHDIKLLKKLQGANVQIAHGMAESLNQLQHHSPEFIERMKAFFHGLISHYVLDQGKLVVAHAGLKEEFHGRGSGKVRAFALFGDVNGKMEGGLPIRNDWQDEYQGKAMVVYGHTAILEAIWINNTIDIDTGCVFGGSLTALRYPERELVSVPAAKIYVQPIPPLKNLIDKESNDPRNEYTLDIEDVIGKKILHCRHYQPVTIKEDNAPAALEIINRFGIDPKWMIYLPPTMSPTKTSALSDYLEHPNEAFDYFRSEQVSKVICEEKHMGSRAIVVICKDQKTAQKRFGENGSRSGVCYTRTGRAFFNDQSFEMDFIERMRTNLTKASLWQILQTDWVCLDCEIMPWSAKAQSLLKDQYAPVGTASRTALLAATEALKSANLLDLANHYHQREEAARAYVKSYKSYCWPVATLQDYKIAPFHILASEGSAHFKKDHLWHMNLIQTLSETDPHWLKMTSYKVIDVNNEQQCAQGIDWWQALTDKGGEGTVVKPLDFLVTKPGKDIVQPGVKTRGREYLRIIYGPEYTLPKNMERLKERGLGKKQSLALREFALGAEALERFVAKEPLYRVHQCVFGALALESEPIDPRL